MTAPRIGRIHRRRYEFERRWPQLFADVDVLLTPSHRGAGVRRRGPAARRGDGTPFTMLANLCWNPATSIPAGLTADGLPVGLQIIARRHRDDVAPAPGPDPRADPTLAAGAVADQTDGGSAQTVAPGATGRGCVGDYWSRR